MDNMYMGEDDLIYNTATRLPVCLCIDTSGSMTAKDGGDKSRMQRVKEGIQSLYKEIENDDMTRDSAEIAIVGFSTEAYVIQDFKTIDFVDQNPHIEAHGKGDLGLGVLKALELLQQRKNTYKANGVDYYQPWLIIMSDGHPTGDGDVKVPLRKAQAQVIELEKGNKLTVIPVFIGRQEEGVDLEDLDQKADQYLSAFSNKNDPYQIKGATNFSRFFTWLGQSVSQAQGNAGQINLTFAELTDWDEI